MIKTKLAAIAILTLVISTHVKADNGTNPPAPANPPMIAPKPLNIPLEVYCTESTKTAIRITENVGKLGRYDAETDLTHILNISAMELVETIPGTPDQDSIFDAPVDKIETYVFVATLDDDTTSHEGGFLKVYIVGGDAALFLIGGEMQSVNLGTKKMCAKINEPQMAF